MLFADIVGFTPLSERLGPKRMVSLLNELFLKIDAAAEKFTVERIETTGDGYLAAGGAPAPLVTRSIRRISIRLRTFAPLRLEIQ